MPRKKKKNDEVEEGSEEIPFSYVPVVFSLGLVVGFALLLAMFIAADSQPDASMGTEFHQNLCRPSGDLMFILSPQGDLFAMSFNRIVWIDAGITALKIDDMGGYSYVRYSTESYKAETAIDTEKAVTVFYNPSKRSFVIMKLGWAFKPNESLFDLSSFC